MGGLFKKKSSSTKTTEDTKNSNWLANNKEYTALVNSGISQGANMSIPDYQLADYGQGWYNAANNLQQGADLDYLTQGADYMQGLGQGQLNSGLALQGQAQGMLSKFANMTQEDYQKGFQSEYNGDLVKEQVAGLTSDVNDWYLGATQSLNQSATQSGNMGSSRAGVAQGVLGGQAAKAISSGSLQYRTAEESAAQNRYMSYLGMQQSGANALANLAGQQISTGSNFYNQGMGYQSQYNAGWLQNQQNALNVGSIMQQQQQNQLDIMRQNSLQQQSPALARLGYMNQFLGPIANYSTTGSRTTTTVAPAQGNGMMGGIMGAAGAVAGAYFGGPMGAQLGASLGGAVGNSM
ncbi:hypothetical protein BH235_004611 [Salmonella enterica subsp. enterica serovar Javiana]|nr:hypothetical protein [Salmonella enterica subsp. enterica serovar Javiana]